MAYFRPMTVEEAVNILDREKITLKPIAGCTDVCVQKEEGLLKIRDYLDLSYVDSMKNIEEKDSHVIIGALVTHADVASSELIKEKGAILAQACSTVGSPQIRNRGTIGGNINHASPSGDSIPALITLNAEILLQSKDNKRWIPLVEFFTGPGQTIRKENEIMTAVRFKPLGKDYFCLYQKLGQRKSLACSKASLAFVARVDDKVVSDVRIAMGAVAPTVIRAPKTEKFLEGKKIESDTIQRASELAIQEAKPISDLRSTAEYRKNMMGSLIEKALKAAMER